MRGIIEQMLFTDSPYELLMKQIPGRSRPDTPPPQPPKNDICYDCPFRASGPCILICHKQLSKQIGSRQKKEGMD